MLCDGIWPHKEDRRIEGDLLGFLGGREWQKGDGKARFHPLVTLGLLGLVKTKVEMIIFSMKVDEVFSSAWEVTCCKFEG